MNMTYLTQPPKKWTFEQPKLKEWVLSWCKTEDEGDILNLFAGKVRLHDNELRVDVSNEFEPHWNVDAETFVRMAIMKDIMFNTIILDPPYNLRKSREKYDGKYIGSFTKIKNMLPKIIAPNGNVITLGYDTVGMAACRGFKKIAVCVVCHNGDHNDTLCLVERKLP